MWPENGWERFLDASLENLDRKHHRRRNLVTSHLPGAMIVRDDQPLINFGCNDYLGLRNHQAVVSAAIASLHTAGLGSGASPAVTGYSPEQAELERRLAAFNNMSAALVFSSGYSCNVATITGLAGDEDVLFSDSLNHASLIDGCRLSKATRTIYPHNDSAWLTQCLASQRHKFRRALIITESIFSMDGDAAPLAELADLAERYDCGLIVDEAHATGVYGATGAGLVEEMGLSNRVLAKLGTLSKAIGCLGGYVCGSTSLVEHILNFGRNYMYSTALPSSVMSGALAAIDLVVSLTAERSSLRATATKLRQELIGKGLLVLGCDSPIVPIVLGEESSALELSEELKAVGIYVPAIRPPTVPVGSSRLRVSLSTLHTDSQIRQLVGAL